MKSNIWWNQVFALVGKEFKEIRHDSSSWLVAFALPLIFLLLFGYGITLDAGILPISVINESGGAYSLALEQDFAHSPWFVSKPSENMLDAGKKMSDSIIQGVVVIREDFDRNLKGNRPGAIQLIVDGSEPNNAQFIRQYGEGMIRNWQKSLAPGGLGAQAPVYTEPRIWFNPVAKSEMFLVPGSITVIMTLIGTLLTSLVFAREWERGTLEALIATPVSKMQILLGKLVPYYCLGMTSMFLCVFCSVTLFSIPFKGSFSVLFFISSIFMLSALGQGLLISVCLKGQLVAAEAGLFTGFLPALMLSGFVFDIDSMAKPMQMLTKILPATYFNTCIRTLFLAGDYWAVFLPCLGYMSLLAVLLLTIVYLKIPSHLPKT